MLLEECENFVKEKKIPKYIIDNIENFSDFERKNSDEKTFNKELLMKQMKELLMKKIQMKKIRKYFF